MHGQQTIRLKSIWCKLTDELIRRKLLAQIHPVKFTLSDQEIKGIVGSKDKSDPLSLDNAYDELNCIRHRAADAGFNVDCLNSENRAIKVFVEIV